MLDSDDVADWLALLVSEADCVIEGVLDTLDVAAWLALCVLVGL